MKPLSRMALGTGLLVLLVSCLVACQPRKDLEAQPDMLVVLLPTLSADPSGMPGAEAALMASFADQPVRSFTRAYSQSISPHTSLGSFLSGLYPSAMPLCGFADFDATSLDAQPWCASLPQERALLPQALEAYGWRSLFLHTSFLEQDAYDGRFGQQLAFLTSEWGYATPWPSLEVSVLEWWGQSDDPRLLVLQLADLASALPTNAGSSRPSGSAAAPASFQDTAAVLGTQLASLVQRLERSSHRPLVVVLTSPHGYRHDPVEQRWNHLTQLMAPALLEERTLHVPLHFVGSAVQHGATHDEIVELRAVLPTLLGQAGVALPASVEPRDLLSDDPADHGDGTAYAEVGDMLSLARGRWLLRFRTMVHHGTALSADLTAFLQHPPGDAETGKNAGRSFYWLQDLQDQSWPPRDASVPQWEQVLALRDALIAVRAGPAAPHERAMDPQRLLELRMTASDGYW